MLASQSHNTPVRNQLTHRRDSRKRHERREEGREGLVGADEQQNKNSGEHNRTAISTGREQASLRPTQVASLQPPCPSKTTLPLADQSAPSTSLSAGGARADVELLPVQNQGKLTLDDIESQAGNLGDVRLPGQNQIDPKPDDLAAPGSPPPGPAGMAPPPGMALPGMQSSSGPSPGPGLGPGAALTAGMSHSSGMPASGPAPPDKAPPSAGMISPPPPPGPMPLGPLGMKPPPPAMPPSVAMPPPQGMGPLALPPAAMPPTAPKGPPSPPSPPSPPPAPQLPPAALATTSLLTSARITTVPTSSSTSATSSPSVQSKSSSALTTSAAASFITITRSEQAKGQAPITVNLPNTTTVPANPASTASTTSATTSQVIGATESLTSAAAVVTAATSTALASSEGSHGLNPMARTMLILFVVLGELFVRLQVHTIVNVCRRSAVNNHRHHCFHYDSIT